MEYLILALGVLCLALALWITTFKKHNNVHFYVTRDSNDELCLWLGKPFRGIELWVSVDRARLIATDRDFNKFLPRENFRHLTWKDNPQEVFLKGDATNGVLVSRKLNISGQPENLKTQCKKL